MAQEMCRERAIEILNRDDEEMRRGYFCINDFLAIEVLKQEPFMNKPCVSAVVCEHDKMQMLDNLRTEIMELQTYKLFNGEDTTVYVERNDLLDIIDKYRNGEQK